MKISLAFFFALWLAHASYASDTLVLSEEKARGISVDNRYIDVYEDTSATLTIQSILSDSINDKFKQVPYNYNQNPSSVYWLRIRIKNEGSAFTQYVVENYYLHATDFSIFYTDHGKIYKQATGEAVTYSHRDYRHKNQVVDLPMANDDHIRTFYFRVYSPLYVNFNIALKTQHYFTQYSNSEYLLLGIYYGIIFLLILYNIILYFTIRAKVYIYYIFYLLAGILISLNEDKLGYQYLWPESPYLNPLLSFHVSPVLLVLCFIMYSTEFLELRKRYYNMYATIWISFLVYMIIFIINFYSPVNVLLRILTTIPFLLVFASSILVFSKGYKSARFFIAGSGLIFTSIVLIQLRALAIIMGSIFTVYMFNYSLIIESIILSIALSDKIRLIRQEKEIAQKSALQELEENTRLQKVVNDQLYEKQQLQEKVTRELEVKVSERTVELSNRSSELEIANAKLESIIEQTNHMNIKLDLDNWELKKNVRHELVQRITGQEVSIDMFRMVFKDDKTCLRFLDELKWSQGYVCSKCQYTKYKEVENTFIKKCSRCSHPESVTAGTVLHGIKFSISSALYLIYIIHSRKGNIRLEEITTIAGISIVSSSKFKSKIMEKMNQLDKKKKSLTWEEIILN